MAIVRKKNRWKSFNSLTYIIACMSLLHPYIPHSAIQVCYDKFQPDVLLTPRGR